MIHQTSIEYLERLLASCPWGSVLIIGYGQKMYELVRIEIDTLWLREVIKFKLTDDTGFGTRDTRITGFWYLPREGYVQTE